MSRTNFVCFVIHLVFHGIMESCPIAFSSCGQWVSMGNFLTIRPIAWSVCIFYLCSTSQIMMSGRYFMNVGSSSNAICFSIWWGNWHGLCHLYHCYCLWGVTVKNALSMFWLDGNSLALLNVIGWSLLDLNTMFASMGFEWVTSCFASVYALKPPFLPLWMNPALILHIKQDKPLLSLHFPYAPEPRLGI